MNRRKGFTLIELVVVIMILGILATVAAPKFISTSGTATDNGLKQTLSIVRDAIELYTSEHGGDLPGKDGSDATFISNLDPYLRGTSFPKCPVGPLKDATIKMVSGNAAIAAEASPTKSWAYNYETGEFIVNCTDATKADATVTYDKL